MEDFLAPAKILLCKQRPSCSVDGSRKKDDLEQLGRGREGENERVRFACYLHKTFKVIQLFNMATSPACSFSFDF